MHEIAVFSGSAHPELATEICQHLGIDLVPAAIRRFSNDCLEVHLKATCRERDLTNTVVSPDFGSAKPATRFARLLGVPVAAGTKQRVADDRVVIETIVGDVSGKNIIIMDDEIPTAGSIVELLARLRERGAGRVAIACTHGLFTGPAIARLGAQPDVDAIVTTNTVPLARDKRLPHLQTLSIAPLLAEAIRRIHEGESVSSLFETP